MQRAENSLQARNSDNLKEDRNKYTQSWRVGAWMPVQYMVVEQKNFFTETVYDESIFGYRNPLGKTRRLVVMDEVIARKFGKNIVAYFRRGGVALKILVLSLNEEDKNTRTLFRLIKFFKKERLQRRSEPVIAIGGGVLMDVVGLAASLYRRGVPYVRIPTTLMGLIDAGIGVKTGINFYGGKNLVGTYFSPTAVVLDVNFLTTLSDRHLANGMAEIVKMALIKDAGLFTLLEKSGSAVVADKLQQHPHAPDIVRRSVSGMLDELVKNLWEKDLERLVDFGHTFSPKIEMTALPELLHGEAVALDMALCVVLAYNRGWLTESERERILSVFQALNLPINHPVCEVSLLTEALEDTTRHRDGWQRLPLPQGIGNCKFVNDVVVEEISDAITYLRERANEGA